MIKNVNPKVVGNLIYKLRESNNITQEEFARDIGVTKGAISQWENGDTGIKTEKLYDIAKYFNITVKELIEGKLSIENDEEYFARNYDLDEFENFETVDDSNYYEVSEYLTRCQNVLKRIMTLFPLYIANKCTEKQHNEFRRLFKYFQIDYDYTQQLGYDPSNTPLDYTIEELRNVYGCDDNKTLDFELHKIYEMRMKVHPIDILKYGKDLNLLKMYYSVVGLEKANELLTNFCDNRDTDIESDLYIKQLLLIGASCYYTYKKIKSYFTNEFNESFLKELEGVITENKEIERIKSIGKRPVYNDIDPYYWKSFNASDTLLIDHKRTERVKATIFLRNDKPFDYFKTVYKVQA